MDEVTWPTVVVLETTGVMRRFRQYAERTGKHRDLPDDMVDQVIYCLKKRDRAELRLDELVTSIAHGDFEYPLGDCIDDGVGLLVLELGEIVFAQLIHHCLYDEYGDLPYRHMLPRERNFNNVILRRNDRGSYGHPMLFERAFPGTRHHRH